MTGEMQYIDQNGYDSNGASWPIHAAITKAIGGTLKPFDVYQGPYILIPNKCHNSKLWVVNNKSNFLNRISYKIYREDTKTQSFRFYWYDIDQAIKAAESLL